ncbi:MAG: ferredoxin family protein [Candidatus Kariarchaeaceae archaeon]
MFSKDKIVKQDIKNKLGNVNFVTDGEENAHITIKPEICVQCPHYMCMYGCPTRCYNLVDGKMSFQFEDCVECGTCDLLCDQGSVTWNHPRGSFGVKYIYG